MKKNYNMIFSLGMIGAIFYVAHTIIGQMLWKQYNPITTDISSLTAVGAPNRALLSVFCNIYNISMILFLAALLIKSFKSYNNIIKAGYLVLFLMELTSMFGYSLFPLTGKETEMNFQNIMHILVTIIVVFTTISSSFLIAIGYIKEKLPIGKVLLIFAVLITVFGATVPISMNLKLNVLGLTERLEIYTIQLFVFILSFCYTFGKGFENKQVTIPKY